MATASHASIASGTLGHAFLWPLKWLLTVVLIGFLMGLAAIAIAWIGKPLGFTGSSGALHQATQAFEQSARFVAVIDSPIITRLAQWFANSAYALYFELPQIDIALKNAGQAPQAAQAFYQASLIEPYRDELLVAMQAIQTLAVRFALVIVALPIVLLSYGLGSGEGFLEREFRKLGAGRESASLYHRAKFFQLMFVVMMVTLFLLWPKPVWPLAFLVPLILGVFALARLQCKYYKKYL